MIKADSLADVPLAVRGAHGRRLALLRLVAAERFLRALGLAAAGIGLIALAGHQQVVLDWYDRVVNSAGPLGRQFGWNTGASPTLHKVEEWLAHGDTAYVLLGIGLILYGVLQLVEAFGLWGGWHWAEYLAVVATSVFVPWDLYEIINHPSVLKLILLPLNIAIVVYLIFKGRLFGVRGGHRAGLAEIRNATFAANILRHQGRDPNLLTGHVIV